jgi:hypothetical protein
MKALLAEARELRAEAAGFERTAVELAGEREPLLVVADKLRSAMAASERASLALSRRATEREALAAAMERAANLPWDDDDAGDALGLVDDGGDA